jgi:hypothetical protein
MKPVNPLRKHLLCLSLILGFSFLASAQGFEGSVEFKQITVKDTTINVYYVKGNKVKLDQLGKTSHKAEGTFLFDLTGNKITGLNPGRKVYTAVDISKASASNKIDTVIKLKDMKTILGYKCQGYTVKSKADNTQITYWLAAGNFNFFAPVVRLWNRKDKASVYFNHLKEKDVKGMFPLLSIESDLSGKELSRLEVTKVDKKVIDAATLEIPKDYKKVE